ncbi:MAG: hypothetical protein MK132_08450 [Lentisphaerales bacterium]|nr:hypothetical protein [Lentisphaerales bacterium]
MYPLNPRALVTQEQKKGNSLEFSLKETQAMTIKLKSHYGLKMITHKNIFFSKKFKKNPSGYSIEKALELNDKEVEIKAKVQICDQDARRVATLICNSANKIILRIVQYLHFLIVLYQLL